MTIWSSELVPRGGRLVGYDEVLSLVGSSIARLISYNEALPFGEYGATRLR